MVLSNVYSDVMVLLLSGGWNQLVCKLVAKQALELEKGSI